MQRAAVNTEPALTRAELIAELAASSPHLRQADAELIVATIFDQITVALARGERVELRGSAPHSETAQRPHRAQSAHRRGGGEDEAALQDR